MNKASEVVITGLGIVSPIGIGLEDFWASLLAGRCGVGESSLMSEEDYRSLGTFISPLVAEVKNLDFPRLKQWKILKKNQKVMSRDIMLGIEASDYARQDSALDEKPVAPDRQGILCGAMMITAILTEIEQLFRLALDENGDFVMGKMGDGFDSMFPLWMLKYLPNMTPCHIGIAYDLQGPSNTLVNGETAGIGAFLEATRVILRGQADLMYACGTSSCVYPTNFKRYDVYGISRNVDNPAGTVRPFDINRNGIIFGEGAATCVLESRQSAQARGVNIYGHVLGWAETEEPMWNHPGGAQPQAQNVALDMSKFTGKSIENALRLAMERAGVTKDDLAMVVASGYGSIPGDKAEAQAIANVLGDIPVTAIKGGTGHAMTASGMMEIVTAILALRKGIIPPTLNCDMVAPECPIRVVSEPQTTGGKKAAVVVNYNMYGQASAVIVACE